MRSTCFKTPLAICCAVFIASCGVSTTSAREANDGDGRLVSPMVSVDDSVLIPPAPSPHVSEDSDLSELLAQVRRALADPFHEDLELRVSDLRQRVSKKLSTEDRLLIVDSAVSLAAAASYVDADMIDSILLAGGDEAIERIVEQQRLPLFAAPNPLWSFSKFAARGRPALLRNQTVSSLIAMGDSPRTASSEVVDALLLQSKKDNADRLNREVKRAAAVQSLGRIYRSARATGTLLHKGQEVRRVLEQAATAGEASSTVAAIASIELLRFEEGTHKPGRYPSQTSRYRLETPVIRGIVAVVPGLLKDRTIGSVCRRALATTCARAETAFVREPRRFLQLFRKMLLSDDEIVRQAAGDGLAHFLLRTRTVPAATAKALAADLASSIRKDVAKITSSTGRKSMRAERLCRVLWILHALKVSNTAVKHKELAEAIEEVYLLSVRSDPRERALGQAARDVITAHDIKLSAETARRLRGR